MTVPAPRASRARVSLIALAGFLAFSGAATADDPSGPAPDDGPVYPVSWFDLRYVDDPEEPSDLPDLSALIAEPFDLAPTDTGWVAPDGGREPRTVVIPTSPGGPVVNLHASGLAEIVSQIVGRFRDEGLLGIYVTPHDADIDPETERDLRRRGDTVLRLRVVVGRVQELRTLGIGDRVPPDWRINNKVHRRIRDNSPIQPEVTARDDTTDLVDKKALDAYLHRLNRHPGRRVDAALAPAEEGGVSIDYKITEARPWYAYAQTSNTGNEETEEWQTRIGVVHQQFTNRDDILTFEYLNAGLDDVNAVNLSYEAPWFSARRPRWLSDDYDSPWLSWLPRDHIPWIGLDNLRWGVFGSFNESDIAGVSGTDDFETEEWDVGVQAIYQVWQHRSFFLDAIGRFTTRAVDNTNDSSDNDGSTVYIHLPEFGVRAERYEEISTFRAETTVEWTADRLDREDADLLGRIKPDRSWALFKWDAEVSHFIEPLVNPSAWADPSTPESSTLAHELAFLTSGQWSFDRRLIPQASQVIGGLFSVRGYSNSIATGDSVATGTIEYRYHLARSLPVQSRPVQVPYVGDFRVAPQQAYGAADWDLIFRLFSDFGRTWRNDRPTARETTDGIRENGNDTMVSVGAGVELQLWGNLRARADWGIALKDAGPRDDPDDFKDHRFNFLFSVVY